MVSHAQIHQAEASRSSSKYNWGLHLLLKGQPMETKPEQVGYNHGSTNPWAAAVLQTALQVAEKPLTTLWDKRWHRVRKPWAFSGMADLGLVSSKILLTYWYIIKVDEWLHGSTELIILCLWWSCRGYNIFWRWWRGLSMHHMVSPSPCAAPRLVLSCDTPLVSHMQQKAILWPDPALRSYDD